jgi:Na+/glutamate symporter
VLYSREATANKRPGQTLVLTAWGGFESSVGVGVAAAGGGVVTALVAGGGVKRVNYWENKNNDGDYDKDVDEDEDEDEDEDKNTPHHQSKKLKMRGY